MGSVAFVNKIVFFDRINNQRCGALNLGSARSWSGTVLSISLETVVSTSSFLICRTEKIFGSSLCCSFSFFDRFERKSV